MPCVVTVSDGTNSAVLDQQVTELNVSYDTLQGGGGIVRFLDGSAIKQQRWKKESIEISGSGRVPQGLRERKIGNQAGLDYSGSLTVTIETGLGTDVYTCLSLGPSEEWTLFGGSVSWTLSMEEA